MSEPAARWGFECDRCRNNSRNPYLLCAIHPLGVTKDAGTICPDFDPEHEPDEWWEPEGASFYGDELVITPLARWTREQQLALLDWHPMFTGRCPRCEMPMQQTNPPRVHWDCEHCGWNDDSM